MDIAIRFSAREEAKALPILLRHSQGMAHPDRTYVLSGQAVEALRIAGVVFTELSWMGISPVSDDRKKS